MWCSGHRGARTSRQPNSVALRPKRGARACRQRRLCGTQATPACKPTRGALTTEVHGPQGNRTEWHTGRRKMHGTVGSEGCLALRRQQHAIPTRGAPTTEVHRPQGNLTAWRTGRRKVRRPVGSDGCVALERQQHAKPTCGAQTTEVLRPHGACNCVATRLCSVLSRRCSDL